MAKGESIPETDAYCPLMSLPYVFGTTLESIPANIAYLTVQPDAYERWMLRLGPRTIPRIGIVWSGSTTHKNDRQRSIHLEQLIDLFDIQAEWHCLQKEFRQEDIACLARLPQLQQHDLHLHDFHDTAALIHHLDLVISVDTSVAHVAAATGKPVWILLPHHPDFRWLLDRDDSPWYPTVRLFRQVDAGNWTDVLQQVKLALVARIGLDDSPK
ncbi:glycosyltransferase family 9 protein [Methylophilus aquaticus]|uniref:Glycosyltransferase family 9 protein n=1 Tax=Methylophilus aquaticus TaxID=1971610 RepID=A0ABT9JP46_9PROT|nr:glycosyltransferase family 9 protein [Methylophilus aquaticus]MDP8566362.1 glycosyltransferase family 9 protein [Methylophilus aquaticus]